MTRKKSATDSPASPDPVVSLSGVLLHHPPAVDSPLFGRKLSSEWHLPLSEGSPFHPVDATASPASLEPESSVRGEPRRRLMFDPPESSVVQGYPVHSSPADSPAYPSPPETPDSDGDLYGRIVADTLSPWSVGEYGAALDDDVDTAGWTPVPETEVQPPPMIEVQPPPMTEVQPPPAKKLTRFQILKEMFPYSVRSFLFVCLIYIFRAYSGD